MLMDDGETPVLMDFGSACPARVEIHNRQEALKQQVSDPLKVVWETYDASFSGYCS